MAATWRKLSTSSQTPKLSLTFTIVKFKEHQGTYRTLSYKINKREGEYLAPIKWTQVSEEYETDLSSYSRLVEAFDMLPHVMCMFDKMDAAVGTESHKGPSLFHVFPRTLSKYLRIDWYNVIHDAKADSNVQYDESPASFDACIREFIALHSTPRDPPHELLKFLRSDSLEEATRYFSARFLVSPS